MRKHHGAIARLGLGRLGLPLLAMAACLWSEVAVADQPWRRGGHHGHGYGNGWGHGHGHGWHREHRRHREHRIWEGHGYGRPVIVVPPPIYRRPPVVVIPGYAVPYGYGRGWGYGPPDGEGELRLRLPFR